ncbi:MAG: universal stress protein [Candidatus Rokuibacteriota bacterium]
MAKRILVPLDNTESSEEIIPVVAALAVGAGSSVRLLRVAPVPELVMGPYGRTIAYTDQQMDRLTAEGLRDLSRSEAQFVGVPIESTVRFGDPVEEILLESEAFDADLIALVTSNRSGWRRALSPDVAERVMRKAPMPALVLRV